MPSFLPISTQQVRPRLVCEIRSSSVVVARADTTTSLLAQVAHAALPVGTVTASVRGVNFANRPAIVSALQSTLSRVRAGSRDVTLVVPDASARVFLVDFDSLPSKAAEAIPVVRFRVSKLLPFNAETAAISYQVLSQRQGIVQVLAVAMPREVLEEYESVVREAGFEPGSILPSTLATIGACSATEPVLLLNLDEASLTTAIVRRGEVLLHRMLDLHHIVETTVMEEAGNIVETVSVVHSVAAHVELQQALTVATAFYEDLIGVAPRQVYLAGDPEAETLHEVATELGLEVTELLQSSDILATGIGVPRSLLAGVRGATSL